MLIVDPMKRITIPEIRIHPWFQAHLPRYLAVSPPDTMQQAQKVRWHYQCVHVCIIFLLKSMYLLLFISESVHGLFFKSVSIVITSFQHGATFNLFCILCY